MKAPRAPRVPDTVLEASEGLSGALAVVKLQKRQRGAERMALAVDGAVVVAVVGTHQAKALRRYIPGSMVWGRCGSACERP